MTFDRARGPGFQEPLRSPQEAVAAAMPEPATQTPAEFTGAGPANDTSGLGREEEASRVENSHAVTRDQADQNKTKPAVVDYLRHAIETCLAKGLFTLG